MKNYKNKYRVSCEEFYAQMNGQMTEIADVAKMERINLGDNSTKIMNAIDLLSTEL